MVYTIKIQDKSRKARSIINMLKAMKDDFEFIEITESSDLEMNEELKTELESRYQLFLKNRQGKDWEQVIREIS